ncbi:hypothetical protein [Bizionia gelidisalsuginis]|nr:hypothetical protein [Bizionia gelidisalsuginis]
MKSKKFLIALAIFGGALFTAQASNIIDLNDQEQTQIDKKDIKIPTHG